MLIEGEKLPEPLMIDEALGKLQKITIQRVKASGTIRADSRDVLPYEVGYVGVLLPFPWGEVVQPS